MFIQAYISHRMYRLFEIVKKWQAGRQTDRHAEPAGQAEIM